MGNNIFSIKNTYWNDNGKHQTYYNEIKDLMFKEGESVNNKYLKGLESLTKLYYEVYNNGGFNLQSSEYGKGLIERERNKLYEFNKSKEITKINFESSEGTITKHLLNHEKLEELVNEYLELIMGKNLTN